MNERALSRVAETQQAAVVTLESNKEHQYALTTYAEELQQQLNKLDKLLDTVESDDGDEVDTIGEEVHIIGAKKPTGLFPMSEFLNPASPFYEDATRRVQYINSTTLHPMKTKELQVLAQSVREGNKRLFALEQQKRRQQGISDPPDIDLESNTEGLDWRVIAEKVSNASDNKRSADECRVKWLGDCHPRINHHDWDSDEIKKLRILMELHTQIGKYDWVKIAEELGTNRTPLDCMRHGVTRAKHVWTPESDERLKDAVEKFGVDNWNLVARYVSEDATASQCEGRYSRTLDPAVRRGPWSWDEDERLQLAVAAHGNSWMDVATCVPGRTNDQCRERWSEQMGASTSKNRWSPEEDELLRQGVDEFGNQWKLIASKLGNGKTGQACRLRYDKLKRGRGTSTSTQPKQPTPHTSPAVAIPTTAVPSTSIVPPPMYDNTSLVAPKTIEPNCLVSLPDVTSQVTVPNASRSRPRPKPKVIRRPSAADPRFADSPQGNGTDG